MPLYRKRPKIPFISQDPNTEKNVHSAFVQPCSQKSTDDIVKPCVRSPTYPGAFPRTASEPNESAFADFKSNIIDTSVGYDQKRDMDMFANETSSDDKLEYPDKMGIHKKIANVKKNNIISLSSEIEEITSLNDKPQVIQKDIIFEKKKTCEHELGNKNNEAPKKKITKTRKCSDIKDNKKKLKISKNETVTLTQNSQPTNTSPNSTLLDVSMNSSMSNSQISINEPIVKEAYKKFLFKKQADKRTTIHSQNSDISLNDPAIKETYSQFVEKREKFTRVNTPKLLTHYEKMKWLQSQRNVGVYVYCDNCDKVRYLEDIMDPTLLPDKWYCKDNTDIEHNRCEIPQEIFPLHVQEDWVENLYNAGSIVWARVEGFPWWPGMVDDDPNTESYYWLEDDINIIPTYYHVTFFDKVEVTRAWLKPIDIKSFYKEKNNPKLLPTKYSLYKARIDFALKEANEALDMPLHQRLEKYSFLTRYKKPIKKPRNVKEKVKNTSKQKKLGTNGKKFIAKKEKLLSSDFSLEDFEIPLSPGIENLSLDLFENV